MDRLAASIRAEGRAWENIIAYSTEEVIRQRAAPEAVGWMLSAWITAVTLYDAHSPTIPLLTDPSVIGSWGRLVEPSKNARGFRTGHVRVGARLCPPPEDLERLMKQFCARVYALMPEEAYREFQEIHPFFDGNGRTGKILFNWLNGTLRDPMMPPNFFSCANP